jgi:WD40 repeat protein
MQRILQTVPDGKLIAVGTTLGVSTYEADTLKETLYFETGLNVNNIVFSPNGETLAAGLNDKTVQTWSVKDGSLLQTYKFPVDEKANEKDAKDAAKEDVMTVAFSPDGNLIAAGAADGMYATWQVADGALLQSKSGDEGKLGSYTSCVLFSADSQYLFVVPLVGDINMLQVTDGKIVRSFTGHSHVILGADISADGKTLAVLERGLYGRRELELVVWNVEDGKQVQKIPGGTASSDRINTVALSPDGQYVAAAWNNYSMKIWSVASGALQNDFKDLVPKDLRYYGYFFTNFSPDGKSLLMAGRNVVAIWDLNTGSLLKNIKTKSEPIYDLDMSPNGSLLATVEGSNVFLRHIGDGVLVSTKDQLECSSSLGFSADSNSLLMGTFGNTALLAPISDQGIRKSYEMEKKEYIRGVTISPDGTIVALGASFPAGKVEFRQVSDGLLLATVGLNAIYGFNNMEFSANGKFLGVSINNQTILISVADGKVIKSYNSGISVSISPDSTLMAAGDGDNGLRVWKIPSGENLYTFKDRPEIITRVRFLPDSTLLFAGMTDGAIEVWSMKAGTLLTTWQAHSQEISIFSIFRGNYF